MGVTFFFPPVGIAVDGYEAIKSFKNGDIIGGVIDTSFAVFDAFSLGKASLIKKPAKKASKFAFRSIAHRFFA